VLLPATVACVIENQVKFIFLIEIKPGAMLAIALGQRTSRVPMRSRKTKKLAKTDHY
jgi:hypothetical protein